jgi:hypothetical protein
MKKITYVVILGCCIAFLAACTGQPGYDSPSELNTPIISGHFQEIELLKIEITQQNEITGLWKAINVKNNSHSKISFDENGYVQEDIYSNLTGEKIATVEGQYTTQNDRLEISIINGDVYQFEFTISSGQLNLKSISN